MVCTWDLISLVAKNNKNKIIKMSRLVLVTKSAKNGLQFAWCFNLYHTKMLTTSIWGSVDQLLQWNETVQPPLELYTHVLYVLICFWNISQQSQTGFSPYNLHDLAVSKTFLSSEKHTHTLKQQVVFEIKS